MKRAGLILLVLGTLVAEQAVAQAVPENSQAARLHKSFRRSPYLGMDPFRYTFWPGWGLMISGGASGWNNTVNAADVGAILFLADTTRSGFFDYSLSDNSVLNVRHYLDILGLVPQGQGFGGLASAEGGAYLGGPFGGLISLGASAVGRGYGSLHIADSAVAFFRDGNTDESAFGLGGTDATVLATADLGGHLLVNLGPLGSVDGVHVTLGFGGRYVRPVFYSRLLMGATSRFVVTGDTIAARVDLDNLRTVDPTSLDADGNPETAIATGGSGIAGDALLRLAWPTAGIAFEAMVANLGGKVTIEDVERQALSLGVASRLLEDVADSVDAAEFVRQGVSNVEIQLPLIVRFGVNAWANRFLQLDGAVTLASKNDDFDLPMTVEFGSTWRLVNSFPLRVGMLLGGYQGIGYTGSVGFEARNVLFRISAASLGGLFRNATGASGRLEFGFFF